MSLASVWESTTKDDSRHSPGDAPRAEPSRLIGAHSLDCFAQGPDLSCHIALGVLDSPDEPGGDARSDDPDRIPNQHHAEARPAGPPQYRVTSPYPPVVTVTPAHQRASPKVSIAAVQMIGPLETKGRPRPGPYVGSRAGLAALQARAGFPFTADLDLLAGPAVAVAVEAVVVRPGDPDWLEPGGNVGAVEVRPWLVPGAVRHAAA